MKKRLRKKLRVGEYAEYGYSFECEWCVDSDINTFWDKLVEWHESRGFICGGGSNNETIGWVLDSWRSGSQKEHRSPSDKDRDLLVDWLKKQNEVKSIKATDRIDLWLNKTDKQIDKELTSWKIEWSR